MTEDRWRRVVGPAMVALALLGGAAGTGAVAIATAGAWWDPPPCDGGPAALVAAARGGPADAAAPTPWIELAPVLDGAGTLASQRLTIGNGPDEHRLDLPPESFAGGPFGHIVVVGADDGHRSRIEAIDAVAGCALDVADEAAVVRRATISPDGTTLLEMRVDRTTRADLGIWQRSIDQLLPARRILPPIVADGRFGRTWSTEFDWSVDGDRVAVQSCGAVACRTRVLDMASGVADLVAEPDLGPIVGLTRDHLVVYRACRGQPCPLVSIDLVSRQRSVISDAAGRAALIGRGSSVRIVHEWRDGLGGRHVRSTDADGGHPLDLGTHAAVPDPPGAPAPPDVAPDMPATSDSEVTR